MGKHRCPVWAGYFLASRLRGLIQNPRKILSPYVGRDMTVLDLGSAMGFFSLPMAEMVQPGGQVVCVDVEPRMLEVLHRRATKRGLGERIETHVSREDSLGLDGRDGRFDFALAFAVMHELTCQAEFLGEIFRALKSGASLLIAEPVKHMSPSQFDQTLSLAQEHGSVVTARPAIRFCAAALATKRKAPQP